jgi:hypothetical protein
VAKRKETRKERHERLLREAEDRPIVRQLRELYERGLADVRERERRGERVRP